MSVICPSGQAPTYAASAKIEYDVAEQRQVFCDAVVCWRESMWWQHLVRRGYQPEPESRIPVVYVCLRNGEWRTQPQFEKALQDTARQGLGVLWPSYVSRCSPEQHAATFRHHLEQLQAVRHAYPDLRIAVYACMQWEGAQLDEAQSRLRILGRLAAAAGGMEYLGIALPGPGKNRSINAALHAGRPMELAGWLWIDDDVTLSEGCLRLLVGRFLERGCRGAVGAAVVWIPSSRGWATRISSAKRLTKPLREHPNACCMVVSAEILVGGVPKRYFSDDGFVMFRLLNPQFEDPWSELEVLADALCYVTIGGKLLDILRKQRRLLYTHLICMDSCSPEQARYYFSQSLFYGLWPIAPWDGRNGLRAGIRKWLLKSAYFAWFCLEFAWLAIRGLLGRPLKEMGWAPSREYELAALPLVENTSGHPTMQ